MALFVIAILVGGFLWYISRSITQPLGILIKRMQELATGSADLSKTLDATGNNEFAQLAKYINQLMANLSGMVLQLQQSGIKTATSSAQLASSSREQEATVTEQAATAQQIAASSREITNTSQSLQESMQDVAHLSRQTSESADEGQATLKQMADTLAGMVEAADVISEKFGVLNAKAANISHITRTITKVAEQTNMLSLNAAIEAEKAGEYGRGFSVVATEIRRLADQSAATTIEIETIIKDMQSAVSEGVMSMDKFGDEIRSGVEVGQEVNHQLQQIIIQVQELNPFIESANEGLINQVQGAEEISFAIEQLQTTTQQTRDMVIRTNQTIAELNTASNMLAEGLDQFKVKAQ